MRKLIVLGAGMLPLAACTDAEQQQKDPNVIFIIADDLGYGDLSCYGQEKFQTPNIDALAADGVIFTRHYAGTSVSAPHRPHPRPRQQGTADRGPVSHSGRHL